jgi:hypothetical protein
MHFGQCGKISKIRIIHIQRNKSTRIKIDFFALQLLQSFQK